MLQPSPELAVGLAFLKLDEEIAGRDALEHCGDAAEADLGKAVREVAGVEPVNEELENFVARVSRQLFSARRRRILSRSGTIIRGARLNLPDALWLAICAHRDVCDEPARQIPPTADTKSPMPRPWSRTDRYV